MYSLSEIYGMVLGGIGIAVLVIAFGALYGFIVSLAWNTLLTPVFHLPTINFVQGCAAVILSTLIRTSTFSKSGFNQENSNNG